jgi:hypothetical protein
MELLVQCGMPRVALRIQFEIQTRSTLDKFVHSSSTQSLVLRSRIVLAAAGGPNNQQIAAALKVPPRECVSRTPHARFLEGLTE